MTNPMIDPHTGQPVVFSAASTNPRTSDLEAIQAFLAKYRPEVLQSFLNGQQRMTTPAVVDAPRGQDPTAEQQAYTDWLGRVNMGAIDGYGLGQSRKDYYATRHMQAPDGTVYSDTPRYERESMNGKDYLDLAAKGALVFGGGYNLSNLLAGAGGASVGAAGTAGFSPATNAALIESSLGTAGYGASSAGLGGGAGTLAGIGSYEAIQPTSAALESAIGTPGYGANAAADALVGAGNSGANAVMGFDSIANPALWDGTASLAPTDVVQITAPHITPSSPPAAGLPALPVLGAAGAAAALSPTTDSFRPSQNYGDGMTGAETAAFDKPGISSQLMDLLKSNPRLAVSLLGSIGGKLFGGSEGPASPTGGISGLGQAAMTAQQAPAFNRQYVAAPEGYRPGFDPQHKYFTGIGSVGMTPPEQPRMGIPQEPAPAMRG